MVAWGNLESHDTAWEQAKRELGISDVRDLTNDQFHAATARMLEIQRKAVANAKNS
jgi:hypothetical protein